MARVYMLGAGFSRAISNKMLLTNELSAAVKEKLGGRKIPGDKTAVASNFEQWLSYLIEAPPWLTESDQARNRAAFFDVTGAVYDVLDECQMQAVLGGGPPKWLESLVAYWEATPTTVITFNYDVFVELAWRLFAGTEYWNRSIYLYPVPIAPIGSRAGFPVGGIPAANGLRLLKLHGSLSWRYSGPGSTAGDPIYDLGVSGSGWDVEGIGPAPFGNGRPNAYELSVDRKPMIVPPAAVKSPYYKNRTLQELWRLAAEALSQAEELVMMGFSLPQTDLLISSMLTTTLPKRSKITPVNRCACIVKRISDTFQISPQSRRIKRSFAGKHADPIRAWVEANTS